MSVLVLLLVGMARLLWICMNGVFLCVILLVKYVWHHVCLLCAVIIVCWCVVDVNVPWCLCVCSCLSVCMSEIMYVLYICMVHLCVICIVKHV